MTTDRTAESEAVFQARLTRMELREAVVIAADVAEERVARAMVEAAGYPWPEGDGAWSVHERQFWRMCAKAALSAMPPADEALRQRVEALADELDAKSEALWFAYKHADPADERRANPHTEGESDAYETAAELIRAALGAPDTSKDDEP